MLSRQAIWCQCASVLPIVFALTCIVSFQSSFIEMNILWCFLFGCSGLVHFICGEHGPAFGISIDKWLRIEIYLEYFHRIFCYANNINVCSSTGSEKNKKCIQLAVYIFMGVYLCTKHIQMRTYYILCIKIIFRILF